MCKFAVTLCFKLKHVFSNVTVSIDLKHKDFMCFNKTSIASRISKSKRNQ